MRAALLLLAVGACSSAPPRPAPGANAAVAAPAAGSATVSETACTQDADCTLTDTERAGEHRCCPGCTQTALTTVALTSFKTACTASPAASCESIGCAMPLAHAACVAGNCTVVPNP